MAWKHITFSTGTNIGRTVWTMVLLEATQELVKKNSGEGGGGSAKVKKKRGDRGKGKYSSNENGSVLPGQKARGILGTCGAPAAGTNRCRSAIGGSRWERETGKSD